MVAGHPLRATRRYGDGPCNDDWIIHQLRASYCGRSSVVAFHQMSRLSVVWYDAKLLCDVGRKTD